MPSRRSPANLAERAARRGALAHVQKREVLVAGREARVDQRERKAEKFNKDALALAGEAVGASSAWAPTACALPALERCRGAPDDARSRREVDRRRARRARWARARRPFLACSFAPFASLLPVRTSQQLVLEPQARRPSFMAVLFACRTTGCVGWTTPDARAAASGIVCVVAGRLSRIGLTTVCSGRLTASRCRSVVCVGLLPPQAGATRLPARHWRRAAWRQARGRRQRRWRLGRRRRARHRRSLCRVRCARVWCMYVC